MSFVSSTFSCDIYTHTLYVNMKLSYFLRLPLPPSVTRPDFVLPSTLGAGNPVAAALPLSANNNGI